MSIQTPEQIAADMVDPSGDETALLRDLPDSRKPDVAAAIVAAITRDRAQRAQIAALGLEVQVWQSDMDGITVVQIDTAHHDGRFRINVNDAPIWDRDPERAPRECSRCASEVDHLDAYDECATCSLTTRCPNCGEDTDETDGRERFTHWCTSCVHHAERCGA